MSSSPTGAREIAAGLADALRPALPANAPVLARLAARDVAQLMGLLGLDAALAELERHAGAGRPVELDHLAARIERIAAAATLAGEVTAFHTADRELATLAAQLAATDWHAELPPPVPAVATLTAGETLADLHVEFAPLAAHSRLTMTVASALRAAVDWLGVDDSPNVHASVHDAAFALTSAISHAAGIGPAGAVLATVEGSLGEESDGRWTLRVPLCAERPAFLLVHQGRYGFALPWHAVARLRMFAPAVLARLPEPCLAPLAPLASRTGERPAALLARGLAQAWFVADRVVWRIAAQPREADTAPPFAGATLVIDVEGSAPYWVLDPAWLLRAVPTPAIAPPAPRRRFVAPAEPAEPAAVPPSAPAQEAVAAIEASPVPAPEWPALSLADEDYDNSALAAAVERALDVLRRERPEPIVHDPASEHAFADPPDLAEPSAGEAAVDAILFAEPPAVQWHVEPAEPAFEAEFEYMLTDTTEPVVEPAPQVEFEATIESAPTIDAAPAIAPAPPTENVPLAPSVTVAVPVTARGPRPSELAARVSVRRALIADDSLVARIFLARLLEKRGWIVETVADAAGLWNELHRGPWTLVCADFALPDAQGHGHISRLLHHLGRRSDPATCIVLTRDADEERISRDAGAEHVLRKPFDAERLDIILGH